MNGSKLQAYLLVAGKTIGKTLTTSVTATVFLFTDNSPNGWYKVAQGDTGYHLGFGSTESLTGMTGTIPANFYKGETLHTATYDNEPL